MKNKESEWFSLFLVSTVVELILITKKTAADLFGFIYTAGSDAEMQYLKIMFPFTYPIYIKIVC